MTSSIVFIDSRVADIDTLIAGLGDGTEWFLLSPAEDGVLQMATILADYGNLDSIHVISHGSEGALYLGDMVLSAANLESYSASLAQIGGALTDAGDILLYGCNVSVGMTGQAFIAQLASITGSDVAASNDATGSSLFGGNWILETHSGIIETVPIAVAPNGFNALLAANSAPSFSVGDGSVFTSVGAGIHSDVANTVLVQSDGKIVATGYSSFAVARYNADGSLDTTFDGDGKQITHAGPSNNFGLDAALQSDGKVVVVGYSMNPSHEDISVVRLNANGSLDTSFGGTGVVVTSVSTADDRAYAVAIQTDGKIVAAGFSTTSGNSDFSLIRYNANGALDTTFDGDGKLVTAVGGGNDYGTSVALQTDGKILVAGFTYSVSNVDFALVRYNTNGSLDSTFDGDGKLTTAIGAGWDQANAIALQTDGKILVAGSSNNGINDDFALIRYNANGSLDTTFDDDGKVITPIGVGTDYAYGIVVQSDGKIIVAGSAKIGSETDIALARYNSNGSLDSSFGNGGIVITALGPNGEPTKALALQQDGKIVVGGSHYGINGNDFAVMRYNSDGSLDTSFGVENTLNAIATFTENGTPVVLDSDVQVFDGDLVASGNYSGATLTISRNQSANSIDEFYAKAGGTMDALAEGGNLVVSGTTIGTVTQNSGGSLVLTFNADATQSLVNSAMQQIAYRNTSDAPSSSVQIDWTFSDGNAGAQGTGGALSATGSTTVSITAVNDLPTGTNGVATLDEDAIYTFSATDFGFNDAEDGANLSAVRIDTLTSAGLIRFNGSLVSTGQTITSANLTAGQLTFTPAGDANGTGYASFNFSVRDSASAYDATPNTLTLNVSAVNDAPSFSSGNFDSDGKLTTAIGTGHDYGRSAILQPDGKILVAGQSSFNGSDVISVVRYNVDGSLDTTFGIDGKQTTADGAILSGGNGIALQSDGKILVAGFSHSGNDFDFGLVRYNSDGSLDTSFDSDGKVITVSAGYELALGIALQQDGKILVAGHAPGDDGIYDDFALVRYNANGSLDTTFDGDGKLTTAIGAGQDNGESVVLQSDGKILMAGYSYIEGNSDDFSLVRYNADGSLDATFDGDGKVTTAIGTRSDVGKSVTLQPDGKILVAGSSVNASGGMDFALVRYNTDGSLDNTFDGDGKVTTNIGGMAQSVTLQSDGKILVAGGDGYDFALVRYNSNGSLDTTFDGDGKLTTAVGISTDIPGSVTVQPDGKILVTGWSDNGSNYDVALVRYNSDGSLDSSFGGSNILNGTTAYTENGAAVVLDSSVHIHDVELAGSNYSGATLMLARQGGASSDDRFSGAGIIDSEASGSVVVSGTELGTYTWAGGVLTLSFNTNATQALATQAMQSIAYRNSSDAPPASVQINWNFSDGNTGAQGTGGPLAATGSTTVSITAVNDAPVGAVTISGIATQNQTLTASNTLSDPDGLGAITYQWQADGANINGATAGTLVLTEAEVGKFITVAAIYTDGYGTVESVTSSATSTVINVNDTPTGAITIVGTVAEDQNLTISSTLADADGMGVVSYQWQRSLTGAHWETVGTASSFTPGDAEVGYELRVRADYTDGHGTATTVFSGGIFPPVVANVNDAPTGGVTITGITTQNQILTAGSSLADADGLGTITYQWQASADGNTGWTNIAGATGSTYLLSENEIGDHIQVVASYTDGHGTPESVVSAASAAVAPNTAPLLVTDIGTKHATETAIFSFTVPAGTFTDPDGDPLTYSATLTNGNPLPDWLHFNPATRTFSADELIGERGAWHIRLSASDGLESASDDFILNVTRRHNGKVEDGYVANAELFIDVNGNGLADAGESTGVFTDAEGNFELDTELAGSLLAVGGTNVDTGLANTMLLKAPEGSTIINPLTTLVQEYLDTTDGTVTVAFAETAIQESLGIGADIDLTTYDPLAPGEADATALEVQKLAVQVATLAIEGEGSDPLAALAALIAGNPGTGVDLTDAGLIATLVDDAELAAEIATTNSQTESAGSPDEITALQGGAEVIEGTTGNDILTGGNGVQILRGQDGNDSLNGLAGNDHLLGGSGNDTLTGYLGNDWLDGGSGKDVLNGGQGNDTYVIDSKDDRISDVGGNDTVRIDFALDSYSLRSGIDNGILGEAAGTARLTGNHNANRLTGNSQANKLDGGSGDDWLDGGAGADLLVGGRGDDIYRIDDAGDRISEFSFGSFGGTDRVIVALDTGTSYTLRTGLEQAELEDGSSVLNLTGNSSNNLLQGNAGDNLLHGMKGADKLIGGAGDDTLIGGTGADRFVFDSLDGTDEVQDFSRQQSDCLVFDDEVFAGLGEAGSTVSATAFVSGAGLTAGQDADDRLVFDTVAGNLYYDADGSGAEDAVLVAHLGNATLGLFDCVVG